MKTILILLLLSSNCQIFQSRIYSQNWINKDGLSRRAHVEQVHHMNTVGMSEADVRQHQNDYHNAYGPGHPVTGQRPIQQRPLTKMDISIPLPNLSIPVPRIDLSIPVPK